MIIPVVMTAYAENAKRHAASRGFTLDYTEKSLELVDQILHDITREGLIQPTTADDEKQLWTLSKMYGGYVGEVVVRNMLADWQLKDNPDGTARVVLMSHKVTGSPIEKVYKRLTEDAYCGMSGYCRAMRAIIALRTRERN